MTAIRFSATARTAIGDGLGLAVKKLRERPPGSRVAVLVTDGQNDGGLIPPREAARPVRAVPAVPGAGSGRGRRARLGTIAADTRRYPFGTIMYVPGYGYGRVEDRGFRDLPQLLRLRLL